MLLIFGGGHQKLKKANVTWPKPSPWENNGTIPPESDFQEYEGQESDSTSQHRCTADMHGLTNLTAFCTDTTGSVAKGRAADAVYLDCSFLCCPPQHPHRYAGEM